MLSGSSSSSSAIWIKDFDFWIVINPAGGLMRQMILIFLLFFSQDETNVFFNIDLESKFYFYVQCVVMCVISFFYAVIVQMDHGSLLIRLRSSLEYYRLSILFWEWSWHMYWSRKKNIAWKSTKAVPGCLYCLFFVRLYNKE